MSLLQLVPLLRAFIHKRQHLLLLCAPNLHPLVHPVGDTRHRDPQLAQLPGAAELFGTGTAPLGALTAAGAGRASTTFGHELVSERSTCENEVVQSSRPPGRVGWA